MFKEKYKHMIDQVHPGDELLCGVLKSAHISSKRKISFFYRPVAAVIAVCICMSLTVPALAAKVEPIYKLIYTVSPGIAQLFAPVQKSDEDNGIKMEVLSAYIHGNVAEIYITMQDLSKDRIDDTTDLFDSYSINRPFDSSASCQFVNYDEKTKTATFLISITEWKNKKIAGDKITFSVKKFLSHKKNYSDVRIPIDLSSVTAAEDTKNVNAMGGGGKDYERYTNKGKATVLKPSEAIYGSPVDDIGVTDIGYIGGMLHIQMGLGDRLKKDNHGSFYLKDVNGNTVNCNCNIYFANKYEEQGRIDYCEYVFDIPREEIKNYTLYGDFNTSDMLTWGNWRVTFPLEQAE
ncbi:MAG: DUF4179 domain-containing protein [Bacillota bacterium]|nr:DUF4179 domain-containing protein [Bacillota bacterium]